MLNALGNISFAYGFAQVRMFNRRLQRLQPGN
jgi:hypothetical protein